MPDYMSDAKFRLTRLHGNAAQIEEIIDWTLARFATREKSILFLLQYAGPPWTGESVNRERAYLLSKLNEKGIPYVDTYAAIFESGREVMRLYDGHHNQLGNEPVCKTALEMAKHFQ